MLIFLDEGMMLGYRLGGAIEKLSGGEWRCPKFIESMSLIKIFCFRHH